MSIRRHAVSEAGRRAERQLADVVQTLVQARRSAGLSQGFVAAAIGVSRPTIAAWEALRVTIAPVQLARWGAVVGIDVPIRAFTTGSPMRDVGQLRLLERFHRLIGDEWTWRTEVRVTSDPRDLRAIDAVLSRDPARVGVEAVTRLVDSQGRTRPILLKQEASGIEVFVLVLADSRGNREALNDGAPTLNPAFPCPARSALAALRRGDVPSANAIVMI